MLISRRIALSLASVVLVACSNQDSHVVLPSFRDVSDAPPAIQSAAQAVVRIGTAGSLATGSFIAPTGVLLTNNHVLGVEVCPQEGCYAQITFMHQRGVPSQPTQTVFVVPLAVDVGLDMAVVQAYSAPGGAPLDTPHFLTLESRDAASLQGTHVHVVGHPEGHLKKWTEGEVVDSSGTWIFFTAYSLPGSSGSPVLDDGGHLVGILHRGPTSQDLINGGGVDEYSIGTASAALVSAMSAPLPAALRSINAPTTDAEVAKRQALYLNARVQNATGVDGVQKSVLSILGAACDAGLARQDYASPDDLALALAACSQAEFWIDCRTDVASVFKVCPPDASAWLARYQGVYDHWRALNGVLALDMVSFAPADLLSTRTAGMATGAQMLGQALAVAHPPLDFVVANYLAAFGVDSYGGKSILDFLQAYRSFPDYSLAGTSIASTALWLNKNGKLSGTDTRAFFQTLAGDDKIDLGTKLYIEDVRYQSGD